MGSGDKFQMHSHYESFYVGAGVARFPFTITIMIGLGFWSIQIGFGKGYDE